MIQLWDFKGNWWELTPLLPYRESARGLVEVMCHLSWDTEFRQEMHYEVIPIPVFTEWWPS